MLRLLAFACVCATAQAHTVAVASIDAGANTVTLAATDNGMLVGISVTIASATGQTCASAAGPLTVSSVNGAVVSFGASGITTADASASTNCVVIRDVSPAPGAIDGAKIYFNNVDAKSFKVSWAAPADLGDYNADVLGYDIQIAAVCELADTEKLVYANRVASHAPSDFNPAILNVAMTAVAQGDEYAEDIFSGVEPGTTDEHGVAGVALSTGNQLLSRTAVATCADPGDVCVKAAGACPAGCGGSSGACTGTATCALAGGGLVADCDTADGCVYQPPFGGNREISDWGTFNSATTRELGTWAQTRKVSYLKHTTIPGAHTGGDGDHGGGGTGVMDSALASYSNTGTGSAGDTQHGLFETAANVAVGWAADTLPASGNMECSTIGAYTGRMGTSACVNSGSNGESDLVVDTVGGGKTLSRTLLTNTATTACTGKTWAATDPVTGSGSDRTDWVPVTGVYTPNGGQDFSKLCNDECATTACSGLGSLSPPLDIVADCGACYPSDPVEAAALGSATAAATASGCFPGATGFPTTPDTSHTMNMPGADTGSYYVVKIRAYNQFGTGPYAAPTCTGTPTDATATLGCAAAFTAAGDTSLASCPAGCTYTSGASYAVQLATAPTKPLAAAITNPATDTAYSASPTGVSISWSAPTNHATGTDDCASSSAAAGASVEKLRCAASSTADIKTACGMVGCETCTATDPSIDADVATCSGYTLNGASGTCASGHCTYVGGTNCNALAGDCLDTGDGQYLGYYDCSYNTVTEVVSPFTCTTNGHGAGTIGATKCAAATTALDTCVAISPTSQSDCAVGGVGCMINTNEVCTATTPTIATDVTLCAAIALDGIAGTCTGAGACTHTPANTVCTVSQDFCDAQVVDGGCTFVSDGTIGGKGDGVCSAKEHYAVYQDGTKIADKLTTTSYAVTGLTAATTYAFTVTMTNVVGEGPFSDALTVKTPEVPALPMEPRVVSVASVVDGSGSTIALDWTQALEAVATKTPVTGYKLYAQSKDGFTFATAEDCTAIDSANSAHVTACNNVVNDGNSNTCTNANSGGTCAYTAARAAGSATWLPAARVYDDANLNNAPAALSIDFQDDDITTTQTATIAPSGAGSELALQVETVDFPLNAINGVVPGATVTNLRTDTEYRFAIQFVSAAGDGVVSAWSSTVTTMEEPISDLRIMSGAPCVYETPAATTFAASAAGTDVRYRWELVYNGDKGNGALNNDASANSAGANNYNTGLVVANDGVSTGVCVATDATVCADITTDLYHGDAESICGSPGDRGGINPGVCVWTGGACVAQAGTECADDTTITTQAMCEAKTWPTCTETLILTGGTSDATNSGLCAAVAGANLLTNTVCAAAGGSAGDCTWVENTGACTFHNALSAGDQESVMSGSTIAGAGSSNCKNAACSVMEYTIPLPGFDDAVPDYDEMEIRVVAYNRRGIVRESVVFGWTPRTGAGADHTENYQTIEYCGCTEPSAQNYWELATYSLPATCDGVESWTNSHTGAGHMLSTVLKDEFEYYQFHYDHTATEVEVTVRLDAGWVDVYVGKDGVATPGATSTYTTVSTDIKNFYVITIPYWKLKGSSSLYITVKGSTGGGAFAHYKVMAKANTFRSFTCADNGDHCTGGETAIDTTTAGIGGDSDSAASTRTIYRAVLVEGTTLTAKVVPTYYYHFYEFTYPRADNDIDVELTVACSVGTVELFASKTERYPSDERSTDSDGDGDSDTADYPGYWSGASHTGTVAATVTTNYMYTLHPQDHADSISTGHGGRLYFAVKGVAAHSAGQFLPSSTYGIKAKVYRYRVESELLDLVGGMAEERRYSVVTLDNFNYYEVKLTTSTSAVTTNLEVHYGEVGLYYSKTTLPTQDPAVGADGTWGAGPAWSATGPSVAIGTGAGAQTIVIPATGLNLVDGYVYFGLIGRTAESSYDLSVGLTQLNSAAAPAPLYNCGTGIVSTTAACTDSTGAALTASDFGSSFATLATGTTYFYKYHVSEDENVDMYVTERSGAGTSVSDADRATTAQDTWGTDWTETQVSTWVDDFSDELNLDVDVAVSLPSSAVVYMSAADPYPSSERGTMNTFTGTAGIAENVATFGRTWFYISITPNGGTVTTSTIRITPTENVPDVTTTEVTSAAVCAVETCTAINVSDAAICAAVVLHSSGGRALAGSAAACTGAGGGSKCTYVADPCSNHGSCISDPPASLYCVCDDGWYDGPAITNDSPSGKCSVSSSLTGGLVSMGAAFHVDGNLNCDDTNGEPVSCLIQEITPALSATPDAQGKVATLYTPQTETVTLDCSVDVCKPAGSAGTIGYVACTAANTVCTMLVPQPMMTVTMSVVAAPAYSKIRAYMDGKPYPRAGANTFVKASAGSYANTLKVYSLPPSTKAHTLNLVLTTDKGEPLAISTRSFTVEHQGGCGNSQDPCTSQGVCHSGYCVCFDGYYGAECQHTADVTGTFTTATSFGASTAYRLRQDALNAEKLASTRFVHKLHLEETTTELARTQSAMDTKTAATTSKLESQILTLGSTLNQELAASKTAVEASVATAYSKQERNTIKIQQAKQEAARLKTANREAYIDQKRALYAHQTATQNANDAALLVAKAKIASSNLAIEDNFREGRFIKNQLRTANGPRTLVSDLKTQSCTTDQFFNTKCVDVDYNDADFAAGARDDANRVAAAAVDAAIGLERAGDTVPR